MDQCPNLNLCLTDDEQRVQISESEFWLISPSENLVRVEVRLVMAT